MKKYILGSSFIIAAVLTLIIIVALHEEFTNIVGAASPSGSTFTSGKFAGVSINLANTGANGTSTSILNNDANDRYVFESRVGCEGVGTSKVAYTGGGLASLQLTIGTTSTSAPGAQPASTVVANNLALSTSTSALLVASSTLLTGTSPAAIWPTGTYMTFWFNATNTAVCTVGVGYFSS